ncbi:MAG: flavohemoglobin expression-modulating QEGLA motif protein [Gammaproteobacteria bacterium]|nr:flavohemoglobin expression-modulating QEGLA motif protein [Gammaproteobacteria bacterium]
MAKAEFSPPELARLEEAGSLLLAAEDKLPVLARTGWPPELAERFFARGASEMPQPVYAQVDPEPTYAATLAARKLVRGESPVHRWLLRLADTVDDTALLLANLGTAGILEPGMRLYGYPQKPLADGKATALELARRLDSLLGAFRDPATLAGERPQFSAQQVKARLDAELPRYFGAAAPLVEVTPHLSAKATAGKNIIRLRATAVYSDLDTTQLLQHEALVHIATGKNGRRQTHFPILGEAHPGNTRTQEGLAVYAEFLSGALDPQRLKRLADRVIAIQMALDGADFIQLYQYFLEVSENEYEAFESARRVARGGLVTGGAPLTKDVVYVQGLLEVHSFLRAAVQAGDPSLARLLFVGKFDLADLDAMRMLRAEGLLVEPEFMPPWVTDLRFLTSYLAYSVFLNEINLGSVLARYRDVFAPDPASGAG